MRINLVLKALFKNWILKYIYVYDPGYFSFIYSIKTLIAMFLSILVNTLLFGWIMAVWAGIIPIYIYFLNTLLSEKEARLKYLVLFIFLSCVVVFIFSITANFGLWLLAPVMLLTFFTGISAVYSLDLQKVLNMVLINGLLACIYVNSGVVIELKNEILTIFIGGMIGIFMQFFISMGKYGKFTKKNIPSLLFDLELMIANISNFNDFVKIRNQTLLQIDTIKHILSSQAGKIKDPHIIKNTRRILFYVYRIEEICHSINSIHHYYCNCKKPSDMFCYLQDEMIFNLKELSKMFHGQRVLFSQKALEMLFSSDANKVFINSIKIIYNKMDSFRRGGEEEAYLTEFLPKKTFKDVLKAIEYFNPTFRYSLKYSLTLGTTIIIAEYFKINHGIWIAMGAIAIIKPNLGGIKDIGKDYFLGTFLGLFIGITFVVIFGKTLIFYGLFVLVLFLFIYLKVFPYAVWSTTMMIAFVMLFAILKEDFLISIFNRFLDILIGFGVVFISFWFIWPKYGSDDMLPNIKNIILLLEKLTGVISNNLDSMGAKKRQFLNIQSDFFLKYDILNNSINEARKEKNSYQKENIKNASEAASCIDLLQQNTNKIYDYLLSFPQNELTIYKEIFENDIRLINTRYEMLQKFLDGLPYYFKKEKDGRFLAQDERFSMIIDEIFMEQNQLYLAIFSNLKH
ncbi:FUSC family protein [Helicobacter sp. 13S00477-4]|uniref:FUSC family protein n=1 Tax=Helicobacter sp. 13S00477-4 TaxID=1905759 RepID=UPI000BA75F18|nr:FUSC family protein [Helicobacter sp. 13S00477-4]PAF52634.1 hypothetical protein BKH44_00130 [Helicobacter sp. 13S00477-4]